jgi:hypothetical protein
MEFVADAAGVHAQLKTGQMILPIFQTRAADLSIRC